MKNIKLCDFISDFLVVECLGIYNKRFFTPIYEGQNRNFVSLGNSDYKIVRNTDFLTLNYVKNATVKLELLSTYNGIDPEKTIKGFIKSIFENISKSKIENSFTKESFRDFLIETEKYFNLEDLRIGSIICGAEIGKWILENPPSVWVDFKTVIFDNLPPNAILVLPEPEFTGAFCYNRCESPEPEIIEFGIFVHANYMRAVLISG